MKKHSLLTIALVFLCILFSCGNEESGYEKAKEANTVQALEEFIRKYPDSRFVQRTNEMIDSLRYHIVKSKESVVACKEFLEMYSESKYTLQVKAEMEHLGRLIEVLSIPSGLDVYSCEINDFIYGIGATLHSYQEGEFVEIGYTGEAGMLPLFMSENRIGKTPCSIEFEPGEYIVGVMRPLLRQLIEECASGVLSLATEYSETVLLKPNIGKNEFFLWDNNIFSFIDLRQKVKIHPFSHQMIAEQKEDTLFYGKMYKVVKVEGIPANVVSLFQLRDETYDTVRPKYPIEANFTFDKSALTNILSEKGVLEEEMPKIIKLLERGGKAIIFGKDDSTVVEITNQQEFKITQIK